MKAYVDSREPRKVKRKTWNDKKDISFHEKELPQADFYLPEHDVAIERKEASDFASSTTDGRLSEQADRMMAEHDHNFLILEGDISVYNLKYSDISDHSIIGMQTSLAVKRDFKIIYTKSIDQTIYAVNRIFERFMDEEHESADGGYVKTADTGEVDNIDAKMISQIDGVSTEKALKICEVTSINDIAWNVSCERGDTQGIKDKIMNVDGVGTVLAQRVIDAFS